MTMTDPIADLLSRVRNGSSARHDSVTMPWSGFKERLCLVMKSEGYLGEVTVDGEGPGRQIRVALRYTESGIPVITGLRRVSRPSLRRYTSAADAPVVRRGLGVSILSTPAGLLPDREARKRGVGGEVVCEVW